MNYISLAEYARRKGIPPIVAYNKLYRGYLPAVRVEGMWMVSENVSWVDMRRLPWCRHRQRIWSASPQIKQAVINTIARAEGLQA